MTDTNVNPTEPKKEESTWTIDVQRGLAWTIVAVFAFDLAILSIRVFISGSPVDSLELLKQAQNALINIVMVIIGYFFGSSKSSQTKDEAQQSVVDKLLPPSAGAAAAAEAAAIPAARAAAPAAAAEAAAPAAEVAAPPAAERAIDEALDERGIKATGPENLPGGGEKPSGPA